MNKEEAQGHMKIMKGKIKERWNELTDDEVDAAAGRIDQLVGHVQVRYGKTKEEAQREVDEWQKENG